jgi:hypothetical protein
MHPSDNVCGRFTVSSTYHPGPKPRRSVIAERRPKHSPTSLAIPTSDGGSVNFVGLAARELG